MDMSLSPFSDEKAKAYRISKLLRKVIWLVMQARGGVWEWGGEYSISAACDQNHRVLQAMFTTLSQEIKHRNTADYFTSPHCHGKVVSPLG